MTAWLITPLQRDLIAASAAEAHARHRAMIDYRTEQPFWWRCLMVARIGALHGMGIGLIWLVLR